MSLKNLYFVTGLFIFFTLSCFAQRNYDDYNRLGITGGVTLFDINTSDLNTTRATGFTVGFTARGAFRNQFDLIYGINFSSSQVEILASELPSTNVNKQNIKFNIQSANLNLLGSFNIIRHHLSVEAGPILQINGKMKVDTERYDDYFIDGYTTIRARELAEITKINALGTIGITAGHKSFRASAQYQYGFTNMLNGLNDQNLENQNFKGNSNAIVITGIVYF